MSTTGDGSGIDPDNPGDVDNPGDGDEDEIEDYDYTSTAGEDGVPEVVITKSGKPAAVNSQHMHDAFTAMAVQNEKMAYRASNSVGKHYAEAIRKRLENSHRKLDTSVRQSISTLAIEWQTKFETMNTGLTNIQGAFQT